MSEPLVVGLSAVIVAVTDETPRVLAVRRPGAPGAPEGWGLPSGPLDPERDRTLELALRSWVRAQTGLELGYVEQLYTFGDRERRTAGPWDGPREISIAYLALVREGAAPGPAGATWLDVYDLFPWEDWRRGGPPGVDPVVAPAAARGVGPAGGPSRTARRERADIAFGLGGAAWDGDRVLDRYELLYETRAVAEALRDAGGGSRPTAGTGRALALDHRRILASALGRLRGKLRYRPVAFELLPPLFTLSQLQRTVEALAGLRLHQQNFRRLVEQGGLVEGTGKIETRTGGRPAELFRFRREVLRERPAPGVGLPGRRRRRSADGAA
ncbi:MAG: NUDIX domain-containing protein [Thermoanaerobaculia bacterium]|nr:NUDIX domain-containing protein [Thermoanaerobaculia bacterium]